MMKKEEINTALKELIDQGITKDVISKGKPLLESYQIDVANQVQEQKEKFESEENDEQEFKPVRDEQDILFDSLWTEFSKLKKEFKEKLIQAENDNLKIKEDLLNKIEALKSEEHIKHAHEAFKEIEQKWKEIGKIPLERIKEFDAAYSKARDGFFYNMHIYRELLENDLKKNLQLKESIVLKMKETLELKSFKDMDATARRLTNEWNEIGPTYKEKWEEIRDEFWESHHAIFNKIKDFYKSQKEKQKDNLEKKQDLVNKLKEVNNYNITSDKSWKKHTQIIIDFQKEWRAIGFAPKSDNEKIWDEFKSAADEFFNAKSAFYLNIKEGYDLNRDKKEKLVSQAEDLIHSEDHRQTAQTLTNLQKEWRNIGSAHHRDEQRLWKKFRAACNSFFESKKNQQKQDTIDQKDNLDKKVALIEKIKTLQASEDQKDSLTAIDSLITEFNQIGFVPMSSKQSIAVDYKNAIHQKLSEFGVPEQELSDYLFSVKINELSGAQNPERALEKEASYIREKIRSIKSNILQYENNLGFFKHSKGANVLKDEVEQKIIHNKQVLTKLEAKLKLVYQNLD
jgi:hypothetical protein